MGEVVLRKLSTNQSSSGDKGGHDHLILGELLQQGEEELALPNITDILHHAGYAGNRPTAG